MLLRVWKCKTLLVMRLTLLMCLFFALQSIAIEAISQNKRLSINQKNIRVEDILQLIEDKTDYYFMYSNINIDVERAVDIEKTDRLVPEILDYIFKGTDVSYKIDGRLIALSKNGEEAVVGQQFHSVSGKVTDSTGGPLPGVSIIVKGTTSGVITDMDGKYTINKVSENMVLQFSFVGMKTQEISIGSKTTINVLLKEETVGIEEVVAVGYGTQKKVNLSGSVGVVNTEALDSRPVQNASQALQGLIPGLNITQNNGELGKTPSINIRGIATIGQGSSGSPLILIDGMEGDINSTNPQDIESISVLKDASASSIYGSRAPFGVILITTKKGKAGKVKINYNNSFRNSTPVNLPKIADSYSFALFINDGNFNGGAAARFSNEVLQRLLAYQKGEIKASLIEDPKNPGYWGTPFLYGNGNLDWFKFLFKTWTPSSEHNVNISGGKEDLTYYLSGSFLDRDGALAFGNEKYKRYNITAKLNAKLTKTLSLNYNGRFIREDYDKPIHLNSPDFYNDIAHQGWPLVSAYDPNGYFFSGSGVNHAQALAEKGRSQSVNDEIYQQVSVVFEPIPKWKIIGEGNFRLNSDFLHEHQLPYYNHDVRGNPYIYNKISFVNESALKSNYFNTNIHSEYSFNLNNHSFKALIGFQSESNYAHNFSASRQGIIINSLTTLATTSGTDYSGTTVPPNVSGIDYDWAVEGFFGRLNYDYKGRYLFEGNLRYDGSSRFQRDNRWNLFPSFSVGWNIAKEDFWGTLTDNINTFKLRGSYGELGNQNTNSYYPTFSVMNVGTSNGGWLINNVQPNTASAPGLVSSTLTWERINTWNLGLDIGAFNNRFTSSLDYFQRKTYDMVGPAIELPAILGTAVPNANNSDLRTSGFELGLSWSDRLKNDFSYNIHFSLSDSETKILEYPNPTGNLNTYYSGKNLGEIWGYSTIGIAKTQIEMDSHLASLPNGGQNKLGSNWAPGDIMYKDINGDKKIDNGANTLSDHGDLRVIGNNLPRYQFGLDLNMNWKGFDFRAFFQGVMKRDFFRDGYVFWGTSSSLFYSMELVEHKDYFRGDINDPQGQNLDSYYPRPVFSSEKNRQVQTRYLLDASYIRLKNVQLGYTLPRSLTQKAYVQNCRIFFSGENIWTGTKLSKIFDPETLDGGYAGFSYPLSKVFSFGISLTL